MKASAFAASRPEDAPREEDYSKCIRCGLCLNACPTFRVLGEEMDSPRGRIYQVAQADAGELPLDAEFRLHMERCLDCRACETACPSGVRYGAIIERTRAALAGTEPRGLLHRLLLDQVVPHPGRLRKLGTIARWLERSGLTGMALRGGALDWLGLRAAVDLSPPLEAEFFGGRDEAGQTFSAQGERRARVALWPGCVQNILTPELNRATVRVMQAQGCEVVVPAGIGCCGALHVHAGLREAARELAAANVAAISALNVDAVITNAAGCGAMLKEYPDLLGERPGGGFTIRDITEFLDDLSLRPGRLGRLEVRVTYQDPCHLAHAQRIRQAPRRLLESIPGLTLIEMQRPDQCCGSAGTYNLAQPDIAGALLADRLEQIAATGAEVVATANPGCMLQLAAGLGGRLPVMHVVELLDQAHRAGSAS